MNQPQTKDTGQMKIRIPASLKDAVLQSAEANLRTMNAEIIMRLRSSFQGQEKMQ